MVKIRSNAPTKSAASASVNNKSNNDFDDDELLAIALPWLSQSSSTVVRSPMTHGGTTTIMYQSSSSSLPSGQMERKPQSAVHVDYGESDKEEKKSKQLPHPATASDEDKEIVDFIRGKLARRAYHLPDNTYCQDYKQYISNCHLIFGLFCYDYRSPVRMKHRLLLLCGSLAFGLNVTNVIYLWGNQVFHDEEITSAFREWATTIIPANIYNGTVATNTILEDTILEDASARLKVDMGSQLTILWTVGAGIHAAFDMALWHMVSCGYCSYSSNATNRQDCLIFGWTTAISIVMLMIIATCVVVYFRVFPMTEDEDGIRIDEQLLSLMDDEVEPAEVMGFLLQGDFSFILAFIIEFAVSLFIWTPFLMTTLFSGLLGCGRVPCIGGRPREVWKERNGKDGRRLYEV